jgi:hypothetical protein
LVVLRRYKIGLILGIVYGLGALTFYQKSIWDSRVPDLEILDARQRMDEAIKNQRESAIWHESLPYKSVEDDPEFLEAKKRLALAERERTYPESPSDILRELGMVGMYLVGSYTIFLIALSMKKRVKVPFSESTAT